MVRKIEVFIEDYAKIVSRVGRFDRAVVKFGQLLLECDEKKFVFRCLRSVGFLAVNGE